MADMQFDQPGTCSSCQCQFPTKQWHGTSYTNSVLKLHSQFWSSENNRPTTTHTPNCLHAALGAALGMDYCFYIGIVYTYKMLIGVLCLVKMAQGKMAYIEKQTVKMAHF